MRRIEKAAKFVRGGGVSPGSLRQNEKSEAKKRAELKDKWVEVGGRRDFERPDWRNEG